MGELIDVARLALLGSALPCHISCISTASKAAMLACLTADLALVETESVAILVNFWRRLHGSETGHWCVLAALSRDGDERFALVLDPRADRFDVPLQLCHKHVSWLSVPDAASES